MNRDLDDDTGIPSSHEPDRATVDRIARTVVGRVARRRRRIRVVRWTTATAAALIVGGLAGSILLRRGPDWTDPPSVAELPSSPPSETQTGSAVSSPPRRVVRASAPEPAARWPRWPARPARGGTAGDFWRGCVALAGSESLESPLGLLVEFLEAELAAMDDATVARVVRDLGTRLRFGRVRPADTVVLLEALPLCRTPRAWPLLAAFLDARGPEPDAIRAAGLLGDPRAVPRLARWLFLGDERGAAAARALRQIPGRESLVVLLEASQTLRTGGSLYVPQAAREIWAALAEREEEVCAYLFDAPSRHRALALRALERLESDTTRLWARTRTSGDLRHKETSS